MKLSRLVSVVLVGAVFATPSVAATLTCDTVGTINFTSPTYIAVNLKQGETLTISTPNAATLAVSIEFGGQGGSDDGACNPAFDGTSCNGFSKTAQLDGEYGVEAFNAPGDTFTMSCGAGGGGTTSTGAGGASNAAAPAAVTAAATQGAVVSAAASAASIGGAVNAALAGTPAQVTQNGIFLSTQGGAMLPEAWASIQGRQFSGDLDGRNYDFTLGADTSFGGSTRVGLLLSYGKSNLDYLGTSVDSDALSFGPYFKAAISDRYSVTGYLVFARPDYDIAGTRFSATRRTAGLSVNADYTLGSTDLRSFVSLSGFAEDHPNAGALAKRTISSVTGSIGTRATFNQGQPLRPYISLAADFNRFKDGLGTESTNASPRVGLGFTYDGGLGTFTFDVNGGEIIDNTRDVQVRLNYSMRF